MYIFFKLNSSNIFHSVVILLYKVLSFSYGYFPYTNTSLCFTFMDFKIEMAIYCHYKA